jgi:hypothetical protein
MVHFRLPKFDAQDHISWIDYSRCVFLCKIWDDFAYMGAIILCGVVMIMLVDSLVFNQSFYPKTF